jgi:hypothetical protein
LDNTKRKDKMEEETITIKKSEYEQLIKDSNWLSCLEGAGVDNWQGYDYAIDMYQEEFPDEDE